jgi:class 3 adenylate cyclase
LRVGLNSGDVIAAEIGSGPFGYIAVGEQVGMAQRMQSAAPPDAVLLRSASWSRSEQPSSEPHPGPAAQGWGGPTRSPTRVTSQSRSG